MVDKCLTQSPAIDINTKTCEDTDISRQCRNLRSYKGTKKWLDVTLIDVSNLMNDVVAKKDASIKKILTDFKAEIEKTQK